MSVDFVNFELIRTYMMDQLGVYVEANLSNVFFEAVNNRLTINQFMSQETPGQVTGQTTAIMSNILINGFWRSRANKIFERSGSLLRIDTERLIKAPDKKLSYDLGFVHAHTGREVLKVESKGGQGKDSWVGSRATTSKVENYMLINMVIDRNRVLTEGTNRGILEGGMFAFLGPLEKEDWKEEGGKSNQRSLFKFLTSDNRWGSGEVEKYILKGYLESKGGRNGTQDLKQYKVVREPLNYSIE